MDDREREAMAAMREEAEAKLERKVLYAIIHGEGTNDDLFDNAIAEQNTEDSVEYTLPDGSVIYIEVSADMTDTRKYRW